MAGAAATQAEPAEGEGGGGGGKRRGKLLLFVVPPVLLALIGGGLFASGILGGGDKPKTETQEEAAAEGPVEPVRPPVFLEMPEIIANLNTGGRRASYVKLRSQLEIARAEDAPAIQAAMPRLLDLFTTYLREMRPEELRGSAGTWRLREELLARANIALATAVPEGKPQPRVTDVLFVEILQQ